MSHLAIGPQIHQNYPSTFGDNSKIVDIPYASPSSVADGPRTIGQKLSQELQIYQQTLLTPKG